MIKFRDGLLGPTVILLALCLIISFALAQTYQVTMPVIKQAEINTANQKRSDVLPEADTFSVIEGIALPEGVVEAYKADNGAGFVFKAGAKGYNGIVTFMVGVDNDGNYTGVDMFEHKETPGLGTKVAAKGYLNQYIGQNTPDAVDSITGASMTSKALKKTLSLVNQAFEAVKGGE